MSKVINETEKNKNENNEKYSLGLVSNIKVKNVKSNKEIIDFGKNEEISKRNIKKKNRLIKGLAISTAVFSVATLGLGIAYGVSQVQANNYRVNLENVYKKNFYNLLDSVNTAENDMAKLLASSSTTYQTKMLTSVAKSSNEAQISVSGLPLTEGDIFDMVKMINQIYGYTSTLSSKVAKGEALTNSEIETLEDVYQNISVLKNQLNEFARKMQTGYSILDESLYNSDGTNNFTEIFTQMNDLDVKYPTMIYDGPFSDSVVNSEIKGLTGSEVSEEVAKEKISKHFKNLVELNYEETTKGRFETYNFRAKNSDDEMLYIQVTKIGGNILTVSGAGSNGSANVSEEDAKNIAINFAKNNGIENAQVVWSDGLYDDLYLNIAPVQNGIILYPDLVKVKINLLTGTVVGYDSTSYFTNHTNRTLNQGGISASQAESKISSDFVLQKIRKALVPLDYNREVVCYEIEATKDENTYYFYINVEDGDTENILKVIQTDNGSLLM